MEKKNGHDGVHNDTMMMEMIREDNNNAFALLYKKYWHPLLQYAMLYLDDKDTCKEMIQELFIKLHTSRYSLKISSSVSSYLYTALRNKILNHIRNQAVYKKHIEIAVHTATRAQNNVDQFIYLKELQEEISGFLEEIPPKYKQVYVLHDQDLLTIKKISELLSRPVNTVEKQLRRVKAHLRNRLLTSSEYVIKKINGKRIEGKHYYDSKEEKNEIP